MKKQVLALITIVIVNSQYPWIKPQQLNTGLPSSIQIYTLKMDSSPFETKLTGGYARFNMNDTNLQLVVKDTNGDALGFYPKTPIEYAEQQQNVVYAVINGGYFDMQKNVSASFLAEKGKVISKNTVNEAENKHPTVGAFGLTSDGKIAAEYIYSYGADFTTYKFQYPNVLPGPVINPDEGRLWNVKQGIGAGPILIKNNTIIKDNVQNFNLASNINYRHPRSVICIDRNNYLYFIAIDGRYNMSQGMRIAELADLVQNLNCMDAMNLDGGGSTLLYANNKIINRPCDPAGPRKVVSAVLIRDRFKKKFALTKG